MAEKKVPLKKTIYFTIVLTLIVSISTGALVYALTPNQYMTITGGIYPGADSYTVTAISGTYYAKNSYGLVVVSAASLPAIITAMEALPMADYSTIKITETMHITNTITINTNASKGLKYEFNALSIDTNIDGIHILGSDEYWDGALTVHNIYVNVAAYSHAAILAEGAINGAISFDEIQNFNGASVTANSIGIHLLGSADHPSALNKIYGGQIRWFESGVKIETTDTTSWNNHNDISGVTVSAFTTAFSTVKVTGSNAAGNHFINCRAEGVYLGDQTGFSIQDANQMTGCETLDFDAADTNSFDLHIYPGGDLTITNSQFGRWRFVNDGWVHWDNVRRASNGFTTEYNGVKENFTDLGWVPYYLVDTPRFISVDATTSAVIANVVAWNSTHIQVTIKNHDNTVASAQTIFYSTTRDCITTVP